MNRRGFLGVLGAAVVDPERALWRPGARLISVPHVVAPKEFRHLSVEFLVNDYAVPHLFQERYVRPAAMALSNRIGREFYRGLNQPRFLRLENQSGVAFGSVGPIGPLPEARLAVAYDVRHGFVGRVECLLEGGERRWTGKR